jgi:hypothetical protein
LKSTQKTDFCTNLAMVQAVSRGLSTSAPRVRDNVRSSEFMVDEDALGLVFSEYFGFPANTYLSKCSTLVYHPEG